VSGVWPWGVDRRAPSVHCPMRPANPPDWQVGFRVLSRRVHTSGYASRFTDRADVAKIQVLPDIAWYCLIRIEVPKPLTVFGNQDPCTESTKPSNGPGNFTRPLNGFFYDPCSGGDDGIRTRDGGFADPCLTTWLRRHMRHQPPVTNLQPGTSMGLSELTAGSWRLMVRQSGRWDSNPRPLPWQGSVLPLNYTRKRTGRIP
jgi:hypothetical protein